MPGTRVATEFRLLGPVEVRVDGAPVALGGTKPRTLLALLLVNAGNVVSVDRIVDELWASEPPAGAAQTVQTHVSRLRKAFAAAGNGEVLATRPSGYAVVEPERLDAARFEGLLERGRERRAAGEPGAARASYAEALALWRGEPFGGVERGPELSAEAARLEDLRLLAELDRIECDLALGRHADVVGELERLVRRHPLQERVRALLMLALYGCGRQADALEVYGQTRRLLVEELGIEPGDQLRELHGRILNQDPALVAPVPEATRPLLAASPESARARLTARRVAVVALALTAATAVVLAAIGGTGGQTGLDRIDADAVGAVDPATGRVTAEIAVGGRPVGLASTRGALWIAREHPGAVVHIDARGMRAVDTVPLAGDATAVAAGAGAVWAVSEQAGELAQIDPRTGTVVRRLHTGNGARAVITAAGAVWLVNGLDDTVWRIDPQSGRTVARIPVGAIPSALTTADRDVWVTNEGDGTLTRIDTATNAPVASIAVGNGPSAVAASAGSVWVANALDGTISRVDPAANMVAATVDVRGTPRALAVMGGALWAGDAAAGSLMRLDPSGGRVERAVQVGGAPAALLAGEGALWTAAQASPDSHRGGTLVMTGGDISARVGSLDPAVAFSDRSQALLATVADGLVAMRRAGGAAGTVVVPDLARSVPRPGAGGLTYRFQLRPGLRFSTGAPVRASDVRASIERLARMHSAVASAFPLDLRAPGGIETDDATGTVSFHLARPNPDFLLNLAQTPYDVLPAHTPARDVTGPGLVGTGPYRVERTAMGREVVLARNPRFRQWSAAAQPAGLPDRIVWRLVKPDSGIGGKADLALDPTPAEIERLRLHDPERLHRLLYPDIFYLWLNSQVPPFDRPLARQAVAWSVDRLALMPLFPDRAIIPTCRLIPPGAAGYDPTCPFTGGGPAAARPDIDRARRLVARSGTKGARVTVYAHPENPPMGAALARTLRRIGYRATVNLRHSSDYNLWTHDPQHHAQVGVGGWEGIFPLASAVIPPLLSCAALHHPDLATTFQQAQFCDPKLSARMDRARALQASDPAAATALWTHIDHALVRSAPAIPLWTDYRTAVTSRRLGNLQYAPGLGPLVDQAWVR